MVESSSTNNPFATPVNWVRKAYQDAILETLNYVALPIEKQKELNNDLKEAEGNEVNVEKLKKWVYATQEPNVIKQIEKKAAQLLKKREEKNDKDILEEKREFENKIKTSAKTTFARDYIDFGEEFFEEQPFYFDDIGNWWLWSEKESFWSIIDETTLLNEIYDSCRVNGIRITAGGVKSEIKTAMQMVGRKHKPQEAHKRWIQFKDQAFSLRSGELHKVTHDFFFTNPLPWTMGETSDTPVMDKLFKEWVGEKYVKTLYEMFAYCCYTDYPIQVLFCLYGGGRNGKTCFLKVLSNFLGNSNLCSTDLDLLVGNNKSRFEVFKLYKKLGCLMGETNFGVLESSAILKKLTGGDLIGFEIKGKNPFDAYNYAKIFLASNSLPSSEDTSEGFYRRWVIIDFPNQFKEGKDITESIPESEYNALARKCCDILPKLLENGEFTHQGTIEDRKNKYIMASNPLPFFIITHMYQNPLGYIRYSEFYMTYTKFLAKNKRRIVSKKEFSKILIAEGFENRRTSKEGNVDYYVEGLELKEIDSNCPDLPDYKKSTTPPKTRIGVTNLLESSQSGIIQDTYIKEEHIQDVVVQKEDKVLSDKEVEEQLKELKEISYKR